MANIMGEWRLTLGVSLSSRHNGRAQACGRKHPS